MAGLCIADELVTQNGRSPLGNFPVGHSCTGNKYKTFMVSAKKSVHCAVNVAINYMSMLSTMVGCYVRSSNPYYII